MLLIGSRALAYWYPEFGKFIKEDTDWDIIGEPRDVPDVMRVEWHDPDHLNNSRFTREPCSDILLTTTFGHIWVAPLEVLTIIKRSHLWRDWQWDKHITQYHHWLCSNQRPISQYGEELLAERIKLTKKAYPQGNPSLNQTNEDFFDDSVKKVYDHDWLHEVVAYPDPPMYTKLKNDFSKAWCEKDLWNKLSTTQKNKCVAEETHVIACERFCIPSQWKHNYNHAYYKVLKKVCTTLTSGWFRDWAIDNFPAIWELRNKETFDRVEGLTNG